MSLPDGTLSSVPVPSKITGFKGSSISKSTDDEDGGIYLQDPSEGLLYQGWSGKLVGDDIILWSNTTPETVVFSGSDITEFSFTFDQNMNVTLAYMQDGAAKLRWYDSTVPGFTVTTLEASSNSPKVFLDDKRPQNTANSDVILGYLIGDDLYYRQQRDRYLISYLLKLDAGSALTKIGMGSNLRLQFILTD